MTLKKINTRHIGTRLAFAGLFAVTSALTQTSYAAPIDPTSTAVYLEPTQAVSLFSRVSWPTGETVLAPVTNVPADAVLSIDLRQLANDVEKQSTSPQTANHLFVSSMTRNAVPVLSRDGWVCGISVIDNPDVDAETGEVDQFQLRNDLCLPLPEIAKMKALEGNFVFLRMAFDDYKHGNEQALYQVRLMTKSTPLHQLDNGHLMQATTPEGAGVEESLNGDSRANRMISPIKNCGNGCLVVTSEFNPKRRHPKLKKIRPHRGIDLRAKTGTPIVTTLDGVVLATKFQRRGAGKYVIVNHSGNKSTHYFHLSKFKVKPGKTVHQGDLIGLSGMTGGISTGPHLHYEVRVDGVAFNPRTYLKSLLGGKLSWIVGSESPKYDQSRGHEGHQHPQ